MRSLITTVFSIFLILTITQSFGNISFKDVTVNKSVSAKSEKTDSINYIPPPSKNSSKSRRYPLRAWTLNVSPGISRINNKDIYTDSLWNAEGGFGYNIEAAYVYKFSKPFISVGIGLGYSSYQTIISLDSCYKESIAWDSDPQQYLKREWLKSVSEKTQLGYLDIPIFLEFGIPDIEKIGYYIRAGVKISVPVVNKTTYKGYKSTRGYYEALYTELFNVGYYNFIENESVLSGQNSQLKSVVLTGILSAGITFPINNKFIIYAGANLNYGFSEISEFTANNYEENKYTGDFNKLLGNPNSSTTIQSLGIEIGLIYSLRNY